MPNKETDRIYKALFGKEAPEDVEKHFNILSKRIEDRFSDEEVNNYLECMEKVHDLEALELAARHLKKLPVLSEKFKIMVYLAETRSENYDVFVNEEPGFIRACILLISSVLRTGYKGAKGMVILAINKI